MAAETSLVVTEIEFISLLLVAVLVAVAVKHIKLPYTIALVLCGAGIGFLGIGNLGIDLTEELILFIFLPGLLFEGAIHLDFGKLKENLSLILAIAIIGLGISILFVGYATHLLIGLPLIYGLLFGAMIMPTDPVSVLALFKKMGVSKRLSTLVEGESLFNDGTGIVIFGVIVSLIKTGEFSPLGTLIEFLVVVLGGLVIGFSAGYAVYGILKNIDDHLTETLLTIILAYGTFVICEQIHVSGVIGVVAAGLLIGNKGTEFAMSPTTRITIIDSWELLAFIINSLIFLLIGLELPMSNLFDHAGTILVAIMLVVIARALVVYPLFYVHRFFKKVRKVPKKYSHVMNWGGIHGSIPIALFLSLSGVEHMEQLSFMVFGVVFFSLVFQGLSMEYLIKHLGLAELTDELKKYMRLMGRKISIQKGLDKLDQMRKAKEISKPIYEKLSEQNQEELEGLSKKIEELIGKHPELKQEQTEQAQKRLLAARKASVQDMLRRNLINEDIADRLVEEINSEMDDIEN